MQIRDYLSESFFYGMNDRCPTQLLPSGYCHLIENALVYQQKLFKRAGTTAVAAQIGTLDQDILGLATFQPVPGTNYIVACINGAANSLLYYWTGTGNFATLGAETFTVDLPMNFVQAVGSLFGFNGTEVVDISAALAVTKNRAGVPLGKFGCYFHNYLFVAGVAAYPNRLYWSDINTPTTFTAANVVDINPGDGDEITGLATFNDELYVFKRNTIWSVSGWAGSTFSSTTVGYQNTNSKLYGIGTPSHKSIVATGKDLFWISYMGGIPHFRCLTQTAWATSLEQGIVSFDIETTMDGLHSDSLDLTTGIFDGKYVRWAVPNGSSTYNNLVLVFEPTVKASTNLGVWRSWVKWTGLNPSAFINSQISGEQAIYYGSGDDVGLVYKMDASVYTDNGTAVPLKVQTRDFRLDVARKAKWVYLFSNVKTGSGGSLNVYGRIQQYEDFTLQNTLSLVGSSPGLGPTGTFTLGVSTLGGTSVQMFRTILKHLTGHTLQLEFDETGPYSCELHDYRVYGVPKGLRAD